VIKSNRMRRLLTFPLLAAALLSAAGCVAWTPRSARTSPDATVIPAMPLQTWGIESCGAGALSTILQHHGDIRTMQEWDATLPKTHGGVMSVDLLLAARQRGFDAKIVTGNRQVVESELNAGRPLILMMQVIQAPGREYDFFHYIVLDGIDRDRNLVRIQFGDGRPRWTTLERIEKSWAGGGHAAILIDRPHGDALQARLREAVALEERGAVDEALVIYRNLSTLDGSNALVWTNLGNAASKRGQTAEAERAYLRALELAPDSSDAQNNLAWFLFEQHRSAEAEPYARKAAAHEGPDRWVALDTLARVLAANGDCAESIATFTQAIELLPASHADGRAALDEARSSTKSSCTSGASAPHAR
jgi:hypothetical protein